MVYYTRSTKINIVDFLFSKMKELILNIGLVILGVPENSTANSNSPPRVRVSKARSQILTNVAIYIVLVLLHTVITHY